MLSFVALPTYRYCYRPIYDYMTDTTNLSQRQQEIYDELPAAKSEIGEKLGVHRSTVGSHLDRINDHEGFDIKYESKGPNQAIWYDDANPDHELSDEEPDGRQELSKRESYIYRCLPESVEELADDLEVSEKVVEAHLDTIEEKGWNLEGDEHGNYLGPDQDHLRNSEHKQTRTRKANRWWQSRHDELVHRFKNLSKPLYQSTESDGQEDWVLHLTDLHVGDRVRRDDGRVVYDTNTAARYVDYITEQSLSLADRHGAEYDTCYLLWGGDMVTNEGIYEGQFEDLDSWLDEQLDTAVEALLHQVAAHAQQFERVEVIAQIGNHGDMRASGTSRQANADLILYKQVRNIVSKVSEAAPESVYDNVAFRIGEAKNYRNFTMRDGAVKGHLRHGDDAKSQAQTASGRDKWGSWQNNWDFDIGYCGHFHISKREEANGKPVLFSGSPKPAAEYAERLGVQTGVRNRDVATCHGVSDEGITTIFPIDTRHMDQT